MQLLALGGMGAVYEADDRRLKERVALKLVRPELLGDPVVVERFRREINVARRVTHPNVCRILDVGFHRDAETGHETSFFTMELLRGETLHRLVRSRGRLDAAEALPLVTQVAAALEAVHRAGIVHRDLKAANVMIEPGPEGVRAVVTDFGLALSMAGNVELSSSGQTVGTAAYMAPEQAHGQAATPRSDLYSLGVLMFEMVTGAWPHAGESPFVLLARRLTEPPADPRTLAPDLPERWAQTILRCLANRPEDRFGSALEVVRALTDESFPLAWTLTAPPSSSGFRKAAGRRRALVRALALLALLSTAAGVVYLAGGFHRASGHLGEKPIAVRPSVAVLGFRNLSGRPEAAWLSTALQETLAAELGAGSALRVVPSETVARLESDLGLGRAGTFGVDTLGSIRRSCGSDFVVTGSYLGGGPAAAGPLRVDIRLQDARSGETLATITSSREEAALLPLVSDAGQELRGRLGVSPPTAKEAEGVRGSLPVDPEAARLYAEGLSRLRAFDLAGARSVLTRCVDRAPDYAPAHAALSDAHLALGWDARATEAARKAADLSAGLPREQRLEIEARAHERSRAWAKAIEGYSALFLFYPDDVDHGLRLVGAQLSAGQPPQARETLAALKNLPPILSGDPRITLAEARVADRTGDFKSSLALATDAAARAADRGSKLLGAEAALLIGRALLESGKPAEAERVLRDAGAVFLAADDLGGVAGAQRLLFVATLRLGRSEEALELAEELLPLARKLENRFAESVALTGIAGHHQIYGDLRKAYAIHEQLLALYAEVDNVAGLATALSNLAGLDLLQGELARGRSRCEEALGVYRKQGNRSSEAGALVLLADLSLAGGDLPKARQGAEEALAVARAVGAVNRENVSLLALARAERLAGELPKARARLEGLLARCRQAKEKGREAEALLGLAVLALDEGKPAEAEALARRLLSTPDQTTAISTLLGAGELLARSLLALGRPREAREESERSRRLAREKGHVTVALSVSIVLGQASAGLGEGDEGLRLLTELRDDAHRRGLLVTALEADLALGSIERKVSRSAAAGRARLLFVEEEARRRGLGLLARQAADAARG